MMLLYPLNDDIGLIELIDIMGNDLTIVNDARVSYGQQKTVFSASDEKLINYLLLHKHYSPLRGVVLKFLVKCPLFVARQWWRHAISSCTIEEQRGWNEQSLRYVEIDNQFYIPDMRSQSKSNKQGSETILKNNMPLREIFAAHCKLSHARYDLLLQEGVSREVARTILPTSIYTNFRWTASLESILYFIQLRTAKDSQWEIQQYAKSVETLITPYVPYTLKAYQNMQAQKLS